MDHRCSPVGKISVGLFVCALLLTGSACSTMQPTDAGGPRGNEPQYPVVLAEDPVRFDAALLAATQVIAPAAPNSSDIRLHPVTGTILALPAVQTVPLYLPKIGTGPVMSDEETRESLRRFIETWRNGIGADPQQLSLLAHVKQPGGTQLASYEQRPFRYPLRGEFGKLQIRFADDRRLIDVNSTCIPDTERLQPLLAAVSPTVTAEDAIKNIQDNGVTYTDPAGQVQTIRPSQGSLAAKELVFYVFATGTDPDSLEFHLAWSIEVNDAPVNTIYVDAVKNTVLAAV